MLAASSFFDQLKPRSGVQSEPMPRLGRQYDRQFRVGRRAGDAAPKAVKEKVTKAESEDMKKKLEEQGGTVQVR